MLPPGFPLAFQGNKSSGYLAHWVQAPIPHADKPFLP